MTEIITRAEAKALGLTRYFTAKPCKHGHVAERSVSRGDCVVCHLDGVRRYQARHPEKKRTFARRTALRFYYRHREEILERARLKRAANPEKINEDARRRRAANPEKYRETGRRWRAANLERVREVARRWRAANLEKALEKERRYHCANRKRDKKRARDYRAANPQKIRETMHRWRIDTASAIAFCRAMGLPLTWKQTAIARGTHRQMKRITKSNTGE